LGFIFLFSGLAMVRNIQNLLKQHQTEINTFKPPQKLVTARLLRYSRNPIYLGFSIALFGVAIVLGNVIAFVSFLAFIIAVNLCYIPFEEAEMEKQFGQDYLAYNKKVRRWL
jgi:protein-S-isoprenylcysteine O-methyltransferase Ste14